MVIVSSYLLVYDVPEGDEKMRRKHRGSLWDTFLKLNSEEEEMIELTPFGIDPVTLGRIWQSSGSRL